MALTRPTFNNLNTTTSQAYFNDPQLTINYGNVTANNQDVGFVLNRGSSGNVAVVWSETTKGFILAYTSSTGLSAGNISVTGNANLRVGNLTVTGVTSYSSAVTGTDLTLSGNLTVNGTTVTLNSATVTTNDKNIVVANNQSTSSGIDGAGVDAGGGTPIATWRYNNATTSWQSNVAITPAVTNTLTLGGSSNYWNNIYSTTHTGTTGTFSGTITAATVNAATIGNSGATLTGTIQTAAQTNITSVGTLTGLTLSGTLTGTTLNAATIGNSGSTLTGTLQTASQTNITAVGTLGSLVVTGNISSGNLTTSGQLVATGDVSAAYLRSTNSSGDEGGEILLYKSQTNSTLSGTGITIDSYQNKLRIFEQGGTARGAYIDISQCTAGVGTNLLAGSGGGTPGGSSSQIQYNSGGLFAGASGLVTDGLNLTINAQGDLRFADSDSSNWVAFQSPATISANVTWTLPSADGSANQALVTNGSGTLSWAAAGAAITNDTSTTVLYPSMANVTTGYLTDARVSSTKFTFNANTGTISTVALNAATIGNVGASLVGTLSTASQTNITAVGTLTGLTLSGTLTGTTINAAAIGNSGAALTGTIQTATQTNITSVGTLTGLTLSGALNGTTINAATIGNSGATLTGTLSAGTQNNITAATGITTMGNVTTGTWTANIGAVSGANLTSLTAGNMTGTIPSAVLGNSTHYIGTTAIALNRASASQTLTGVSIDGSAASATTATTATNLSGGTVSGTTGAFSSTLTVTTSISRNSRNVPTYVAAASVPASPLQGDFWYNSSNDTLYQYIYDGTNSQWVDQSIPTTYTTITVGTGSPTTSIINAGTAGTGNIGASGAGFNTIFAKSTSAQYADLAENYSADAEYEPGTVVIFGGSEEITVTKKDHDHRVAGVISTNPAYLMNSEYQGLPVAFTGRVPCKVVGPVQKGDVLVTSEMPGIAQTINNEKYTPGCVIGKALEDNMSHDVKTIEVVVGRF